MKIGIVGQGSIGTRHAANARALGHEVFVYDPKIKGDVKFERQLYDLVDAVVVATPSPFHEGPVRAAIERGKHVLVEKPISVAIGGLPALLRAADEKKLTIMMGNNLHFHPCVQEAKRLLDSEQIGPPMWAQFTCGALSIKHPYLSDGVILNTGSHEVNLALLLFGPVKEVLCASVRDGAFGDEIADFVLLHENGVRSSFHIDFVSPNEIREGWIVGEKMNIGMELRSRVLSVGDRPPIPFRTSWDDDYREEMTAFVERIQGIEAPGADGWMGLATLQLLLNIKTKARAR